MRSEIFKNAWTLKKLFGYDFSKALKTAWKAFKNKVAIEVSENYKGTKFLSFVLSPVRRSMSLDTLLNTTYISNQAARHDYGNGIYNGD